MKDILERLANSSPNEGSHDLQCRCFDAAEEISRLRDQVEAGKILRQSHLKAMCFIADLGNANNNDEVHRCRLALVEYDAAIAKGE